MTQLTNNPLLGQATGDRIGGPIRMALILGNSIADTAGLDTVELSKRYLAWYRTNCHWNGQFNRSFAIG